jgi:hypothetical protein
MSTSRFPRVARSAAAVAMLLPVAVLAPQPAVAAGLSPGGYVPAHRVSVLAGSGTVNDPWVPSKSATIVCDSATVWGNYNGTSHSTPLGTVIRNDTVSVRYETSDHNSVMAYSARANTWGFILRSCVQFA